MQSTSSIVETALKYATERHDGQYRKTNNFPYVWHCLSVSKNVENFKTSKNIDLLIVAALLHDVVELFRTKEEQTKELHNIADRFGFMVAGIVSELTSDKDECSRVGKAQYLKEKMLHMSSYALVIKLCDRLDNISDLNKATPEFRDKYKKETHDIISFLNDNRELTSTHLNIIKEIRHKLSEVQ